MKNEQKKIQSPFGVQTANKKQQQKIDESESLLHYYKQGTKWEGDAQVLCGIRTASRQWE